MPRDIDPECREVDAASLHDVDDVQAIVEWNAPAGRPRHAGPGDHRLELSRFERWLGGQEVMPTVTALRERANEIVSQVLSENATRWESLSATDRERIEMMARAIANRLLHESTVRIKGLADREDSYLHVSALRELFGLDAGTEPERDEAGDRLSGGAPRRTDRSRGGLGWQSRR